MDLNEYLRPELRAFAKAMEDRLRANDHKGGWKDCFPQEMIERCRDEVQELDDSVDNIRAHGPGDGRIEMALQEAADVANFAMMVADIIVIPQPDIVDVPITEEE